MIVPSGRNDGLSPASFSARGAGPDALVPRQIGTGDGHHEVVVEPRLPRRLGEVVRAGGELVLPLPRDREPVGEQLVGLAQRDRPLRRHPLVDQPPAQRRRDRGDVPGRERPRRLRQHPWRPGHRLHPAGQHDVRVAGLDRPRGLHRGVQRRAAQPVHRHRRHRDRQAGQQHRHPADVAVVLAGLVGTAPDHVPDHGRVQRRCLGQHPGDRGRRPGRRAAPRPAHHRTVRTASAPRRRGTRHSSDVSSSTSWAMRNAVLAAGTPQ